MIVIVMMEHGFELIFLWSSPGSGYQVLSEFSPNSDDSTCRDPSPIISRYALPNDFDDGSSAVTSLTGLVTRGMLDRSRGLLIRSLNVLLGMHWQVLRWPFSSSCTVVENHHSSGQSNHRESDQRHNHDMLGNSEAAEGNDMPRERASGEESCQFKARNSIPYEDSESSSHKRKKGQEKETHFEEQSTAIQNGNPKRQAVNRASIYSSCLSSIIKGNNIGYIPNSITDHDVMVSTHMGTQPSLESISTQPLNSVSSIENIKLLFDNLIALPLEDLSNPEKETSMKKALSILVDNLSLFSEEQAEQILELLFEFPALVHSWREYSLSHMCGQKSSAEMGKIRDLVKTSMKDEESLKVRYEELKNKEKELMRQLEAVQKEKAEIAEKSKQTKDLMEKEARRNQGERLMRIATTKLNNLSDQWAKLQSFFI